MISTKRLTIDLINKHSILNKAENGLQNVLAFNYILVTLQPKRIKLVHKFIINKDQNHYYYNILSEKLHRIN